MAYTDLTSTFVYKGLLTWQQMDALAENDAMFIRNNISGQTITSSAAADLLTLDMNHNANALSIDCESTTSSAISITAKYGMTVSSDISNGRGLIVSRNLAEAGANPLVTFQESNAASTYSVLTISNQGSGKHIGYTPSVTRYRSIAPPTFVPLNDSQDYNIAWSDVKRGSPAGSLFVSAPINDLPHGATITSVKAWWYRDDAAAAGAISLMRQTLSTGAISTMATMNSNATTGIHSVEDTTITNPGIDNSGYIYALDCTITPNDNANDVYLLGVVITFTIDSPEP